jgi:hypothetical protein
MNAFKNVFPSNWKCVQRVQLSSSEIWKKIKGSYLYGSHPVVLITKQTTRIQSNKTQIYFN